MMSFLDGLDAQWIWLIGAALLAAAEPLVPGVFLIWLAAAEGREQCLLLGPDGAGLKLQAEGVAITLITPHAPLGRQLLGQGPGDSVQIGAHTWAVLRVE